MIRIKKPDNAPEILIAKGARKCAEICNSYDKDERKFDFDKKVYGHKSVK